MVQLIYRIAHRMPGTRPTASVLCHDANEAARRLRPAVVVASWLTQRLDPTRGDVEGAAQASVYGADEHDMLSHVQTYIHVGHVAEHGRKRLLALPHEEVRIPGLLSRSLDQGGNVIYVWDNPSYRV